MPEEEASREWIVEPPPAQGEIAFHVALGEGVELSEEQERALNDFVQSLEFEDAEVTGHGKPDPCKPYVCSDRTCKPVTCSWFECTKLSSQLTAGTGAVGA